MTCQQDMRSCMGSRERFLGILPDAHMLVNAVAVDS